MTGKRLRFAAAVAVAAGGAALLARGIYADTRTLAVVPNVDYERYAGTWFEIARLPNRFQEQCASDVSATYTPRRDGRITVINRCRRADGGMEEVIGVARRVKGEPPSVLKVRFAPAVLGFLPAVWGDYQIIELSAEYDRAVVASPDRKYLWILSRSPHLDERLYTALVSVARAQGFDVSKLIRTAHTSPSSPPDIALMPRE